MKFKGHSDVIDLLAIYTTLFHLCYSYEIDLAFNSHNCDENARRVSEDKQYILTWLGKTDPRLCSFNFTGGSTDESHSVYKVCYQSVDIELPPFDMFLLVSNDSKKWEYDGGTRIIEETCVEKAYNMMVKIVLSNNYKESTLDVLKLKITAHKIEDLSEATTGVLKIIENILETALPFAIVVIVLYIFCRNQDARDKLCSVVTCCIDRVMGRSSPREPLNSEVLPPNYSDIQQSDTTPETTPLQEPTESPETQYIEVTMSSTPTEPDHISVPPPSYDDVIRQEETHSNFIKL